MLSVDYLQLFVWYIVYIYIFLLLHTLIFIWKIRSVNLKENSRIPHWDFYTSDVLNFISFWWLLSRNWGYWELGFISASVFPLSGSDDEDVAPLSAKFADIYPLNNYDDAEVVANMNGIHSELNGGDENMALKDEVQHLDCLLFSGIWILLLKKSLSFAPMLMSWCYTVSSGEQY